MSSVVDFPVVPSVPSLVSAVEEISRALDTAAELVGGGWLESLSAADLLAVTSGLQSVVSRAQALAVVSVAEIHGSDVARSEGFVSTSGWLERRAGLSRGASRSTVALAEKLAWDFDATVGRVGRG